MPRIIKTNGSRSLSVTPFERSILEDFVVLATPGASGPEAQALARERDEEQAREAYDEGLRQGMAAGEERFRESVGETAEVLRAAAERIETAHQEFLNEIEPQLVKLATSIASKIIDREASISEDVVKRTVRAALEKAIGEEQVTVRVNSKDLETLRTYRAELLQEFDGFQRIELVPDESINPGGCMVQTDSLRIDGRLNSQLESILNELLG